MLEPQKSFARGMYSYNWTFELHSLPREGGVCHLPLAGPVARAHDTRIRYDVRVEASNFCPRQKVKRLLPSDRPGNRMRTRWGGAARKVENSSKAYAATTIPTLHIAKAKAYCTSSSSNDFMCGEVHRGSEIILTILESFSSPICLQSVVSHRKPTSTRGKATP